MSIGDAVKAEILVTEGRNGIWHAQVVRQDFQGAHAVVQKQLTGTGGIAAGLTCAGDALDELLGQIQPEGTTS